MYLLLVLLLLTNTRAITNDTSMNALCIAPDEHEEELLGYLTRSGIPGL